MKITFLGTGTSQGVPVIACECEVCQSLDYRNQRLRSSILIENEDTTLVVDTGPDFRQQMLSNRVKKLDAVLFTHEHKDHTAGMDDIRSFNFRQQKDMPIYGRPSVLDQIKMEFSYIFRNSKYPGIPKVELNPITGESFQVGSILVEPVEVMHHLLPIYGFKIGKAAYITDIKTISESEKEKLFDLDILIISALQKKEHISHLTLDEALALIAELKPKKAFLTHISHYLGLHQEVQLELPTHVKIAYDELTVEF